MDEILKSGTFASYETYKEAFDAEVRRTELGFVRIGYMLRVAKDTDILKESGYDTMEEFAWNEYRLDKSQTSRFIKINQRFSVDGYSDQLQERFRGFGVAKLGEMLTLPAEVIEILSPKLSRSDIQDIKREIQEEQNVTDLEVMMEEPNEAQEAMDSSLKRFAHQYIHDNPKSLEGFCAAVKLDGEQMTGYLMDLLAPSGYAVHMARIQGTGKMMLTISGKNQPLNLMNVRTNEKEEYDWKDLKDILHRLIMDTDPETCWGALYEEPYPPTEEEKEARRQREAEAERKAEEKRKPQEAEEKKVRQAEERRVQKEREHGEREETAKKQEVAPVQPETQPEPAREPQGAEAFPMPKPQEDVPAGPQPAVQMEVEDYPGVVPDKYITCHNGTQVTEPKGGLRDEGCRLAEEVMQWMKTGTMEYARETQRNIARLGEIMKEIVQDEECN
ncbi:hypothetical protein I6E91_26305 [Enterocloster clostridioformis]|uniref:hypothetical protein n=1 Tax=Enterocloster clostridioformis TaxID=1531 RepID=UPI001F30F119|nr:hypothetical protein [Enterocloster clostridioformis]MCF2705456.1 hypothetical protein [Enterocloster clostridioformis]